MLIYCDAPPVLPPGALLSGAEDSEPGALPVSAGGAGVAGVAGDT